MTRVLRALGVTAALLVVCSLLGAGSAGAADRTARAADPATTGAPAVGACYDLTYRQAYGRSAGESTVACSQRHTMVVTAVGALPPGYDWATIGDGDLPAAAAKTLGRVCDASTKRTIAGPVPIARTLWKSWWFAPSEAEVAAGARWFSCEVAVTVNNRLLPVPAGQPKRLTGRIANSVAKCARVAGTKLVSTPCSTRHQWRANYSVLVHKRSAEKPALAAARRICPRHAGTKDDWLYTWSYVTKRSFVLTCERKTRH